MPPTHVPEHVDHDEPWGPVLTVPNAISLARLLCVPVFVWLLFGVEDRFAAALLLAVLGTTDWIDGYIARRFDQGSRLGVLLDPTADRIMLLVAVTCIAIDGSVPWWFAGLTLAREGLVAIAALLLGALGVRNFEVSWWGKTGTFLLMMSYPLFLVSHADVSWADEARVLAWICGIPGLAYAIASAVAYIPVSLEAVRARRQIR
ncbi:MAG: CDP-alcohol phosphatidyltransferase family protein [Acidimicrobiales bacterium]